MPKSLHYIAEIIGRFDLVALTEVRRDLGQLLRVMEILPFSGTSRSPTTAVTGQATRSG